MLAYLRVRGLALLDDVSVTFSPGMNVLTGETGAGKSIIVGALSLLRGARGRAEIVRDGAEAAVVDAQFEPAGTSLQRLQALLHEHGLPSDDAESLVLQRIVSPAGRGRSFVQATLTTQSVLGGFGEELIDICSQHEHHFLTHASRHLEVLDAYAGLHEPLTDYAARYVAWRDAQGRLVDLQERTRDRSQRADFLRFQIEEIDRVAPEPGEYDQLRRRLTLLREAHRWAAFAAEAQAVLYENDDAIAARLALLSDRARGGAEDSEVLAQIQEQLAAAQIACEEAAQMASRFAEDLEIEPGELDIVEERVHELESLRRKHGVDLDELAERLQQMRNELEELEHADDHLAALQSRVDELEAACLGAAKRLHKKRTKAADGLARAVEAELSVLHMPKATMQIRIETLKEPGPHGIDAVEFLFSANPGESVAPLRKVASGGELSRVLLAIKNVLASGDQVATYVFDEVDAGVGGAVAESIGRRLKAAAGSHQVLCITHLPQIAAFADAHFRVEKKTSKGRTTTAVVELSEDERIEELARMLGGKKVTASARQHARALLDAARTIKRGRRAEARAERA